MSYLEEIKTVHLSNHEMLIVTKHHIPSMCPEFDPNPGGETYTEVRYLDLNTNRVKVMNWRQLKDLYQTEHMNWSKNRKIYIWGLCRDITPYKELSPRQQMNHDKYLGRYPNPDSKYFDSIPTPELESILLDLQVSMAENVHDSRVYGDRPYQETKSFKREFTLTKQIKFALKNRKQ